MLWENSASLWGTLAERIQSWEGWWRWSLVGIWMAFSWFLFAFRVKSLLGIWGFIHLYSAKQANWGWNEHISCMHSWSLTYILWNGTTLKRKSSLGGGFKHSLFSPLLGEMIQFDIFFQMGWNHQPVVLYRPTAGPTDHLKKSTVCTRNRLACFFVESKVLPLTVL